MDTRSKILLTGAAGFIGSYMLGYLNQKGFENIIIVDDFSGNEKRPNYQTKKFVEKVERETLFTWLSNHDPEIDFVIHLGARTDTTEFDYSIHEKWNVDYSKNIWTYCTEKKIPLLYASSAATYGTGELGYSDDHDIIENLQPLNPYGVSKNEFDKWALEKSRELGVGSRESGPPFWAGLKFFNVYGPNEYHKGRMASMIFHGFNQIQKTGKVKLFRSHKPGYRDGEQLRDFIYVEDVAEVIYWMMTTASPGPSAGIYNLGTGKARTFIDLVRAIFHSLDLAPDIEFIDTPADIRDKYQYFTEATMDKLKKVGYNKSFFSLEQGVKDYVRHFLLPGKYY